MNERITVEISRSELEAILRCADIYCHDEDDRGSAPVMCAVAQPAIDELKARHGLNF